MSINQGWTEKETNHGASTPPLMVHIAFEIEIEDYEKAKRLLGENEIKVEKEIIWENSIKSRSIYFRDPAGNLLEFITRNHWNVVE
jgi:catechol 2,3-dioxygenase-like lactoylglutathione lyase family enzyme